MDLAQQPPGLTAAAASTTTTAPTTQTTTTIPSQQQPPPSTTQPQPQQPSPTQTSPQALTTQLATTTAVASIQTAPIQTTVATPTLATPLSLVTTPATTQTTTTSVSTTVSIVTTSAAPTTSTVSITTTPGSSITTTAAVSSPAPLTASQPITTTTIQSQQPQQVSVTTPQHQIIHTTTPTTTVTAPKILNPQPTIVATTVTGVPTTQLTWPQAHTSLSAVTTAPTFVAQLPLTSTPRTVQLTLVNRPPTTLPIVPINATTTPTTANIKAEPNKFVCCLLDNGVRCDRVAGNASFSARIQKIIGTKKMNLALDPTVRHAYICEHHKAIITVAKKSTALNREPKANAKNNNYNTANSNANSIATTTNPSIPYQGNNASFNDLSRSQQQLQHPINLEMLTNQNRLANNHPGVMNNMPMTGRGTQQVAHGHYQNSKHPNNQMAPMDVIMSTGFDNTGGGDNIPSSSGGIEVDLQQLQVNTLRRYKRHFRVQTRPGLNKLQLAEALMTHFRSMPIIEKEAITYFVYIVKSYRNKLDHNPKAD